MYSILMKPFFTFRFYLFFFIVSYTHQVFSQENIAYQIEIQSWQKKRDSFLISPQGWVNLAGLFWLQPGKNTFGSDAGNNIVYANKSFPKKAGYFLWDGDEIKWVTSPGIQIHSKEANIKEATIFAKGISATLLETGSFQWTIIKREEKMGVRLRNLASPAIKEFKSVPRFPINEKWRVTARLQPNTKPRLSITNVLGQTKMENSPGTLFFTLEGVNYQLDALEEDDQLFILFGDATSGKTTYPAGRFLYAKKPDENGNTLLDFNKAYNPPCAFSIFATCPLPPKQNILPIAITAGEKEVVNY
jgi:uncharacterized protein